MLRVKNIKINVTEDSEDALKTKVAKKLHLPTINIRNLHIIKKSLDARNKKTIFYQYEVDVKLIEESPKLLHLKDVTKTPCEKYKLIPTGQTKLSHPIVIVGSGPAGLFCAYILAEQGYKVIIIERGMDMDKRLKCVEDFWQSNKLNPNCNIQFGEGGAGTFSDGKLNTLVKDKAFRCQKVFEIFVENGAPEEIMYINKPHIGTDLLRKVIKNIRTKIISRGGQFFYNTTLTNLQITNNKLTAIEVNNHEIINCEALVLAIGHSARDTFFMLNKYLPLQAKPFAVGLRIMHPQRVINEAQYGQYASLLPPASYKLTYQSSHNRGVYSFCMCPGGYVINASSEPHRLVVNGMSNHSRETNAANSALIVTITPDDFGHEALAGIAFQRQLEEKAYQIGKGCIPIQRYIDFKNNTESTTIDSSFLQVKGSWRLSNLNAIFPSYINEDLKEAIDYFGTKIKDFSHPDTILLGVESRTSSPVRIQRDDALQTTIKGIYPCGEGAGYAGGITSAAMDGLKVAESLCKIYSNK